MIISVNDHPKMREVFADLEIDHVDISYTVGGGSGVEARELVILNRAAATRPRHTASLSLF